MHHLIFKVGYSSSSSSKLRDRWHTVSSFPALATNLIRRIASSKQTQGINLSDRDSPTGSRYVISDESPYITPSLSPTADGRGTYKVRDMSTDWLHGSQLPDVTGLFNDPYDAGEDGTTALLADVHRHSSLIKTIVPAPPSLYYLPAVMREISDSYLRALVEFSRVPCQMLEDPSDCDGYSLLLKQSIAGSFLRECEIDKSHHAQKTPEEEDIRPIFPSTVCSG